MSHPNPLHDRENERTDDHPSAPRRGDSAIRKSKRRYGLKQIDKKWKGRIEQGKSMAKIMSEALRKKQK